MAKPVSKQEKERQRKERQKQRKLVELESALQHALDEFSKKGLRSVIRLNQINSNTTIIKQSIHKMKQMVCRRCKPVKGSAWAPLVGMVGVSTMDLVG